LFDRFLFLAELARMKYADLQAAAGLFLDQAAHEAQRLYGRIILALGIGGAKFPRQGVRRDGRQKQPNGERCCPRKIGATIHRQLDPLLMKSMAGKKGSMIFGRSLLRRKSQRVSRAFRYHSPRGCLHINPIAIRRPEESRGRSRRTLPIYSAISIPLYARASAV